MSCKVHYSKITHIVYLAFKDMRDNRNFSIMDDFDFFDKYRKKGEFTLCVLTSAYGEKFRMNECFSINDGKINKSIVVNWCNRVKKQIHEKFYDT